MSRSKNSVEVKNMFEEKMKDSRRLLETDRFQLCIKDLHEILLGLGFPGPISVKGLQSPSNEDFLKVQSFAHHFSESSFQFPTSGVEGETVELLKDLGYPVALSNRFKHLCPKFCPEFLGGVWFNSLRDWILNWLIVQMMGQTKEEESYLPWDLEKRAEFNEPLMEYCCDTYRKFLEGADTNEEDKALINKLLKQFKLEKQRFIFEQKERRMMMEKLKTMEKECQDRVKRDESRLQHILEKQKITSEDIVRENREREEQKQSLIHCMDECIQHMSNMLGCDQRLGGNGAAGVEQGGANTQKSQKVKKVRRRRRK